MNPFKDFWDAYFTGEEMEVLRWEVICSRSYSWNWNLDLTPKSMPQTLLDFRFKNGLQNPFISPLRNHWLIFLCSHVDRILNGITHISHPPPSVPNDFGLFSKWRHLGFRLYRPTEATVSCFSVILSSKMYSPLCSLGVWRLLFHGWGVYRCFPQLTNGIPVLLPCADFQRLDCFFSVWMHALLFIFNFVI